MTTSHTYHGRTPTITRCLGTWPGGQGGSACGPTTDCPAVFELDSGDFAIIGLDVSTTLKLPAYAGCAADERIVVVPRELMLAVWENLSLGA